MSTDNFQDALTTEPPVPEEQRPSKRAQNPHATQFGTAFTWASTWVLVFAVAYGIYLAMDVLVVLLLALLFAILLAQVAQWINSHLSIGYRGSVGIAVSVLLVVGTGGGLLLGRQITHEARRLGDTVNKAYERYDQLRQSSPIVQSLVDQLPQPQLKQLPGEQSSGRSTDATTDDTAKPEANSSRQGDSPGGWQLLQAALSWMSKSLAATFGVVLNLLIIFFVGLFLALEPGMVVRGFTTLFPPSRRGVVERVLSGSGEQLWKWLVGRLASMAITGAGVGIALAFLGVPLAITLGVLTGLLTFIPNIGAALALAAAAFVALPMGMTTVIWVVLSYLAFQMLESYIVTPLIQQHQVSLPPAILISAQAILAALLGFAGALIASPVLVVLMVLKTEALRRDCYREPTVDG